MIEVRDVEKGFGRVKALRGVSFEAPKASIVGLLGANGAGKTTIIRIITGFLAPDAGSALVAGFDTVRQTEAARRRVGYLPESAPAYPEMLTADFLRFRARLYGLAGRGLAAALERVVAQCHLGPVRRRRVGQLSKGYRQRVGLAAALIHDPPVLVLDEPTNGLDPAQIGEARALLRGLAQERTVLVSSHILGEIEATCDRIVMLSRGRVCADGPIEALSLRAGDGACIVEVRGAGCVSAVRSAPGVAAAAVLREGEDGWVRLRCTPAPGAGDLREGIGAAAARAGVALRELRMEGAGLERLFLETAAGEPGAPAAPAATGETA